jgi:uncharacterized protein (DUF1778 family)
VKKSGSIREFFKTPMTHSAFRLSKKERELWRQASAKSGMSLNDFVRHALRKEAMLITGDQSDPDTIESLLKQILEAIKDLKEMRANKIAKKKTKSRGG